MIGWIIHWLTACWPFDLLTYRPIGWLSVWLIDWATGWVIAYLTGWLARWLIHWFTALLAYEMVSRLNERLAAWLADRLKDTSQLMQRRRPRQRGRQKGNRIRFGKTTTLHLITFLYISLSSLHVDDVKLPIFTFYGGRKHKAAIFVFFCEVRYSPLE